MYEKYFGLSANPFSMTPDPAVLFITPGHREALAGLAYAILERKGFVALTGEAGTGKTSLLARTLTVLPKSRVVSSVILNPSLSENEFIEMMLLDFGFRDLPESKARRLLLFQEFLLKTQSAGQIAVLVVDEAHKLRPAVLEEVRLLSNLEFPGTKLLQIVLAGQPELIELLGRPDLRQLNQRVSVRLSIGLLKPSEIRHYIALRWSKSASTPPAFSEPSYAEVARWSRGIPRLVNSICDNALMLAFAESAALVEPHHITEASRDLSLPDPGAKLYAIPVAAAAANGHAASAIFAEAPVGPLRPTGPLAGPVSPLRTVDGYNPPASKSSGWWRWRSRRDTAPE
jgi:general secretion pathway protein A